MNKLNFITAGMPLITGTKGYKKALEILNDIDDFVNNRHFKTRDEVIKSRDTILDIIKSADKSMTEDSKVRVWINPTSVKRICMDALGQGATFNMDMKSVYMDIVRLNNKISNIVKDKSIQKDIKSEMVSSSLRLTSEVSSFYISWSKYLLSNYPLKKV